MGESLNFTGNNSQGTDKLGEHDLAVISAYVFIVGVLGFIGNLWVLIAFCCYKTLRTTTNLFIVHLAGCDLMLAVMDVAFSFPSTVKHRWLFGAVGCEAFGFVYHFLNAMSFNTLAIISLDRFWVITKPSFGAKITVKRALFCVGLTHVYTLFFTLPIIFDWIGFQEEIYFTGCYLNFENRDERTVIYSIAVAIFSFLVPFAIMIYCYFSIFASVRKRGKENNYLKKRRRKNCKFTLPHWRTARMIVVVIFVFLLCWSPHVIVSLCVSLGIKVSILVQEVTLLLAKSAIIYNPFIYAVLNHRFRHAFIGMFCQNRSQESNGADCSRTPVASGGPGSSFRIPRTSASARTMSERLSERELGRESADQCRLKSISYCKKRLTICSSGELSCAHNVALEQNDPEETMGKAVALEEIGMDNDKEKGIRKNDLITIEQN